MNTELSELLEHLVDVMARPLVPGQGWLVATAYSANELVVDPVVAWSQEGPFVSTEDGTIDQVTGAGFFGFGVCVFHPDFTPVEQATALAMRRLEQSEAVRAESAARRAEQQNDT